MSSLQPHCTQPTTLCVQVLERLRLANALAEYCIAPPAVARRHGPSGVPPKGDAAAAVAAAAAAVAAAMGGSAKGAAAGEDATDAADATDAGGAASEEEGAAACGREQFVAAVRRQDPLARLGLELDEELLDLAWWLLQWRPEARISAAAALRHPALAGVEAAATGRELVRR